MTRAEVLDFLELPDSSTEDEIKIRLEDKLTYFQRLAENAPNDFLKKLHTNNTEKVRTIQREIASDLNQVATKTTTNIKVDAAPSPRIDLNTTGANILSAEKNKEAVAWLVRHTENKSTKTFPLYYGKNLVGRNPHPAIPTIIIDEDPYVSRIHCLLEINNISPLQVFISDDSYGNNGKPSKNGTYINGNEQRLTTRMLIKENDTIQIGMTKFNIKVNKNGITKMVQEVEESEFMKTVVIDLF